MLIGSFFLQLFGLASPIFFQLVIDKVLVHQSMTTLKVLAIGLGTILFGVAEPEMLQRLTELRAEPVPTLQKIIQLMGENFSEEEIRAAVEWGSFDNLQKLETSGTFSQGGMKLVNPSDPSTFKVRRGKVGGYREDFNAQQVAELEALVRDNILPELGYCQDGAAA